MSKLLAADAAKIVSDSYLGVAQEAVLNALRNVEAAAKQGQESIVLDRHRNSKVQNAIRSELESLGYTVGTPNDNPYSNYTISWRK